MQYLKSFKFVMEEHGCTRKTSYHQNEQAIFKDHSNLDISQPQKP